MFLAWLLIAYLAGALPWSVWLGQWVARVDPREQPDGNPGAANVFRAAGWRLGVAVLLLDFLKACLPVAIAHFALRFAADQLFWIALMPTVGHAFSIFLGFRGGRALVALFGVWTGLTLYQAPVAMGIAAIASLVALKHDMARTFAIPLSLFAFLLFFHAPLWMFLLAGAQVAVLASKVMLHYWSATAAAGAHAP